MEIITKPLYTADVSVTGGRGGRAVSSDGNVNFVLNRPGDPGEGVNPELLLAAGWGACFQSAMNVVASKGEEKLDISGSIVNVQITLGKKDDGVYAIRSKIQVYLPNLDEKTALQIIQGTHDVCPYSRSLKSSIEIELVHVKSLAEFETTG